MRRGSRVCLVLTPCSSHARLRFFHSFFFPLFFDWSCVDVDLVSSRVMTCDPSTSPLISHVSPLLVTQLFLTTTCTCAFMVCPSDVVSTVHTRDEGGIGGRERVGFPPFSDPNQDPGSDPGKLPGKRSETKEKIQTIGRRSTPSPSQEFLLLLDREGEGKGRRHSGRDRKGRFVVERIACQGKDGIQATLDTPHARVRASVRKIEEESRTSSVPFAHRRDPSFERIPRQSIHPLLAACNAECAVEIYPTEQHSPWL